MEEFVVPASIVVDHGTGTIKVGMSTDDRLVSCSLHSLEGCISGCGKEILRCSLSPLVVFFSIESQLAA